MATTIESIILPLALKEIDTKLWKPTPQEESSRITIWHCHKSKTVISVTFWSWHMQYNVLVQHNYEISWANGHYLPYFFNTAWVSNWTRVNLSMQINRAYCIKISIWTWVILGHEINQTPGLKLRIYFNYSHLSLGHRLGLQEHSPCDHLIACWRCKGTLITEVFSGVSRQETPQRKCRDGNGILLIWNSNNICNKSTHRVQICLTEAAHYPHIAQIGFGELAWWSSSPNI